VDCPEVTRWVLQYGSHATVLSPKRLRDLVQQEAQKITEQYVDS